MTTDCNNGEICTENWCSCGQWRNCPDCRHKHPEPAQLGTTTHVINLVGHEHGVQCQCGCGKEATHHLCDDHYNKLFGR